MQGQLETIRGLKRSSDIQVLLPYFKSTSKTHMKILGPSPKITWKSLEPKTHMEISGHKIQLPIWLQTPPTPRNKNLESATDGVEAFSPAHGAHMHHESRPSKMASKVCPTYWMFQMHGAHTHCGQVNKFRRSPLFILNFKI